MAHKTNWEVKSNTKSKRRVDENQCKNTVEVGLFLLHVVVWCGAVYVQYGTSHSTPREKYGDWYTKYSSTISLLLQYQNLRLPTALFGVYGTLS